MKVGSAVTKVVPGDSVLLSFSHCNECASCKVRKAFDLFQRERTD